MSVESHFKINPELLELMKEDPEFREQVANLFKSDGYRLLEDLKCSLETLNKDGIEKSSHALKGVFSNTGLESLREQLLPIATWNRENVLEQHFDQAKQMYQDLCVSFEEAVHYIQQLVDTI